MANLDKLQRFPNQIIDNRLDECVGETVADLWGNIQNQPQYPGFSYAAALRVDNTQPTTAGSDPYAGMLSAVIYGTLPTDKEPTTPSELFDANWANYSTYQKHIASLFPAIGVTRIYSYTDIQEILTEGYSGVQLAMKWYENFLTPNPDGTLSPPQGSFSYHCVAIYESTDKGLRVKPWLGPSYGVGGYCFMNEAIFNSTFVSASHFNNNTWRWLNLASAAVTRTYLIPDILPLLSPIKSSLT